MRPYSSYTTTTMSTPSYSSGGYSSSSSLTSRTSFSPTLSSSYLRSSLSSPSSSSYATRTHLPYVSQSVLVAHAISSPSGSSSMYHSRATTPTSSSRVATRSPVSFRSSASSYTSVRSTPSYSTFGGNGTSGRNAASYRTTRNYYAPVRVRERPLLTQIYSTLKRRNSPPPLLAAKTASSTSSSRRSSVTASAARRDSPRHSSTANTKAATTTTADASDWQNDLTRNISRNKYLIKFREKTDSSLRKPSVSPIRDTTKQELLEGTTFAPTTTNSDNLSILKGDTIVHTNVVPVEKKKEEEEEKKDENKENIVPLIEGELKTHEDALIVNETKKKIKNKSHEESPLYVSSGGVTGVEEKKCEEKKSPDDFPPDVVNVDTKVKKVAKKKKKETDDPLQTGRDAELVVVAKKAKPKILSTTNIEAKKSSAKFVVAKSSNKLISDSTVQRSQKEESISKQQVLTSKTVLEDTKSELLSKKELVEQKRPEEAKPKTIPTTDNKVETKSVTATPQKAPQNFPSLEKTTAIVPSNSSQLEKEAQTKSAAETEVRAKKIADVKPKIKTRLNQSPDVSIHTTAPRLSESLVIDTKANVALPTVSAVVKDQAVAPQPSVIACKEGEHLASAAKAVKVKVVKAKIVKKTGAKNGKRQLSKDQPPEGKSSETEAQKVVPEVKTTKDASKNKEDNTKDKSIKTDDNDKDIRTQKSGAVADTPSIKLPLKKKKLNSTETTTVDKQKRDDDDDDSKPSASTTTAVSEAKKRPVRCFRQYSADDFNLLCVLGHGGWGYVFLAELKQFEEYFAIKAIKKQTIAEDDDYDSIMIERKMLTLGNINPFICKLFCTFETEAYLFFAMEFCSGGDLMFHVQNEGKFNEERCKFYSAEIICAVRFLHNRGIVYRDLKLDNILLCAGGHIRLVDFGMCQCQTYKEEMLPSNFCGTPEYIAPEIIKGVPYNHSVDWWSFGVLLYEMAVGKMPFRGGDENELLWNVCYEQIHYPMFMSKELTCLLKLLLEREPKLRLGMATCKAGDIRDQPFFRGTDWKAVETMKLEPPFVPKVNSPCDVQNFDADFTEAPVELSPVNESVIAKIDQSLFAGFPYTNPDMFADR